MSIVCGMIEMVIYRRGLPRGVTLIKILLVNTPLTGGPQIPIPSVAVDKGTGNMPLGLLYLAAALRTAGFADVQVLDFLTLGVDPTQAAEMAARLHPDFLGITVCSLSCYDLAEFTRLLRRRMPACHISLGGPHTSNYPDILLQAGYCDSLCVGYGERAIVELIRRLERKEKPANIPGIGVINKNNEIDICPPDPLGDIDAIAFPDRSLVNRALYSSWLVDRPQSATALLTSRGCPFGCTFCSQSHTPHAQRSVANVMAEVESCLVQDFTMLYFEDDSMNLHPEWMNEFVRAMGALPQKPDWAFRGRVTNFDDDMAKACARSGCVRINFGIESGSEEMQRKIGKGIKLGDALTALRATKNAGIATVCYFIMGFPEETEAQMRQTFDFARRLDADYAIFSPLYLFPGTELYRREKQKRGPDYDPYADYTRKPTADFVPPTPRGMVAQQMISRLVRLAYLRFYFSPHYLFSGKGLAGGFWRGVKGGLSLLAYLLCGPKKLIGRRKTKDIINGIELRFGGIL